MTVFSQSYCARLVACIVLSTVVGVGRKVRAQETAAPLASLPTRSETLSRIAFGSCAKHWQHQSIWEAVIAKKPDLFLFLGDAIYADTDGKTAWLVTEQQLQGEWNRLADKPEFQRARAALPMMAVWDNHDYGSHAGGVEFPVKEASKKIFLDFFGEPEDSKRRRTPGIYDAKIFGPEGRRVQIILLDTRFFKDRYTKDARPKEERLAVGKVGGYVPNDAPSVTLLGEEQWAWLENELRKPAEIRLVCSSTQIIPDEKGMDEWGNFPRERNRLFNLIETTGAEGVILLTGNVHFAEVSRHTGSPYPLVEFTSSGMTHVDEVYAKAKNSYRVAGPFVDLNVGLVEIDWDAQPSPLIALKAVGMDGSIRFEHRVSLSALRATAVNDNRRTQ